MAARKKQPGPMSDLSDDQILTIRSRSEFGNATRKELLADYPMLAYENLRAILDYAVRSKLIPKPPRS